MRATIEHESRGRMRLRLRQKNMTLRQADLLETWLKGQPWAKDAVVHERTCCAILTYAGDRATVLSAIGSFTWAEAEETVTLPGHSTRELNREFQEKLVGKVLMKGAAALFLPAPLRIARVVWHMVPFLHKGIRCLGRRRIKVELLDALSIGISACRRDFGTAGTVMFLLEIGELLEDWTRKKSVADLAESLSLHVDRVWLKTEAGEVLTPIGQIRPGDRVVVRAGGVIPLDSVVAEGEVTVNQASLTGESVPVAKHSGGAVYAGTVVEEGECVLEVKQVSGQGRYDQIVEMIQRSEQMKSAAEAKASGLADKLVPYTFAGSLLSLALTRNVTRALSVLNATLPVLCPYSDTARPGGRRPPCPPLTDFSQAVPVDDALARGALPYALAAQLLAGEDEDLSLWFQTQYAGRFAALAAQTPGHWEPISMPYGAF